MLKYGSITYKIPGRAVTKKNSQQLAKNPKTGKLFPVPSKQYKAYEKSAENNLHPLPLTPIECPVNVCAVYHLPLNKDGSVPKNPPDLTNLLEATDDILVKYKVLKDDNVTIVQRHDGSHVKYHPADQLEEPWTYILIYKIGGGDFEPEEFESE